MTSFRLKRLQAKKPSPDRQVRLATSGFCKREAGAGRSGSCCAALIVAHQHALAGAFFIRRPCARLLSAPPNISHHPQTLLSSRVTLRPTTLLLSSLTLLDTQPIIQRRLLFDSRKSGFRTATTISLPAQRSTQHNQAVVFCLEFNITDNYQRQQT
ncbi:uncharacterized protein B0I36DRAFT_87651 [Microdochium trichocladiopsis]|uniref:Uncharacterized protein n=1 Tax=Microdochium trichocladiopsis TaxID=1682393 RepID=A0A9P8YBY4_9PEZI|nr:uncharacterized protein B0I36DRAFT_87651 [Microdochium trichocladiopsis]KAH7035075.1 hypothetical protein B0I36DRAFT_87651 [Microdochium trichocladiopsis]